MGDRGGDRRGGGAIWHVGRRLAGVVGGLAFPVDCPVCDSWIPGDAAGLCDDCRGELLDAAGPSCRRCAMPVGPSADARFGCGDCAGRRYGFDAAVALGPYQGPIRHLCLALKQVRGAWLAPRLVEVLVEARGAALGEFGAAAVVPVPLHRWRRWRRRYDQAEALARALADRLGLPLLRPLRRVRRAGPLRDAGRVERQRRLRGAFRADRGRAAPLAGRPVLLVDDILTTGATCGAAARALKDVGAGPVMAVVIGRAEGRG